VGSERFLGAIEAHFDEHGELKEYLRCACQGTIEFPATIPCAKVATQEDLLCDDCREQQCVAPALRVKNDMDRLRKLLENQVLQNDAEQPF